MKENGKFSYEREWEVGVYLKGMILTKPNP